MVTGLALALKFIFRELPALAAQSPDFPGDNSSRKLLLLGGAALLFLGAGYYLGSRRGAADAGDTSPGGGEPFSAGEDPGAAAAGRDVIPPYAGNDAAGLREYLEQNQAFDGDLGLERVALRREHFRPFVTDCLAAPPPPPSNPAAGNRVLETGVAFGPDQDLLLGISRWPSGEVHLQALLQGIDDSGRPRGYIPLSPSRTLTEVLDMLQQLPPTTQVVGFTSLAALLAGAMAGQALADVRLRERARMREEHLRNRWAEAEASGQTGNRPPPLDIATTPS